MVESLCFLTKRLAQEVSPYIKQQSDKLLKSKDEPDGKMSKAVDGVVEVAASSLQGTNKECTISLRRFFSSRNQPYTSYYDSCYPTAGISFTQSCLSFDTLQLMLDFYFISSYINFIWRGNLVQEYLQVCIHKTLFAIIWFIQNTLIFTVLSFSPHFLQVLELFIMG